MAFALINPDTLEVLDDNYSMSKLMRDNPSDLFPSLFFNDAELMARFNIYPIDDTPPAFNPETQRLRRTGVVFDGVTARMGYAIEPYLAPSYLEGGERHPTSAELSADVDTARLYYEWCINGFLAEGAAVNEFREVIRVRRPGGFVFERVGKVDNASGYTREDGPFMARAIEVERWRMSVWATAKTLEAAWLASLATETPQPAPTWDQLRAQLPPWPVPS